MLSKNQIVKLPSKEELFAVILLNNYAAFCPICCNYYTHTTKYNSEGHNLKKEYKEDLKNFIRRSVITCKKHQINGTDLEEMYIIYKQREK